jgi:SAM-dependent methyltransferase
VLTLFIGSSSEAKQRGIVPKLVAELSGRFTVRPWYSVFEQGRFTLETLLDLVKKIDLALLVFAKDDAREFRGTADAITRDNVLLEYGLFLAQLERDRVWILMEEGVALPTDLNGLAVSTFRSDPDGRGNDPVLSAGLDLRIGEIQKKWEDMRPRQEKVDDNGLGLKLTLRMSADELKGIQDVLVHLKSNKSLKIQKPFVFDSTNACRVTYTEALGLLSKRFWTTTYLTSGFWTKGDTSILAANARMLKRLKHQAGDARRLFLLSQPPQEEAQVWKERLIHLRRLNERSEIARIESDFRNLKKDFDFLIGEGCQVRIAYDLGEYQRLPQQLYFTPGDSEIAIYDSFRVDIFGGGRSGRIADVRIYSDATLDFEEIRTRVETYFSSLWESAEPAGDFLTRLEEACEAANKRIDYASNWLAIYEFALDSHDEELKIVEMKRVEELLRRVKRWGRVQRHLDVGTCTARYPIGLRDAVQEDGLIIGIDDDTDCIRFANAQRRNKCGDDDRIHIIQLDFGSRKIRSLGRFDLITCMLGTISHFGLNRDREFNDLLQAVLQRMATLLAEDGVLILGNWSEYACEKLEMISIYRYSDRQRLAEWTPDLLELKNRMDAVGLEIFYEAQPDLRLDLLACRHKGAAVGDPGASWMFGVEGQSGHAAETVPGTTGAEAARLSPRRPARKRDGGEPGAHPPPKRSRGGDEGNKAGGNGLPSGTAGAAD